MIQREYYDVPWVYPYVRGKREGGGEGAGEIKVQAPGSKSMTNRALLLAAMAQGTSRLEGVLFCDDSRHMLSCLESLGFPLEIEEEACRVSITGFGGRIPRREGKVCVGSAGTAARFLSAWLGVAKGSYEIDASSQMRARPMSPLLAVLRTLGCEILYGGQEEHLPYTLQGNGFGRREISVNIDKSSQFLSALLIASPLSEEGLTIHIEGSHGMDYIHMTIAMMKQFGVQVEQRGEKTFVIPKGQAYRAVDYTVEPDMSAACYFYAMSPLLGLNVQVKGIRWDSLQGDKAFLSIMEKLGCRMCHEPEGIRLLPPVSDQYPGVDVNMSACSDQAITLAALAPFASTPTMIRGIGHIRYQESNRMNAICTELGRLGVLCRELEHNIRIYPLGQVITERLAEAERREKAGRAAQERIALETYDDHRCAMGFALLGLRFPGVRIKDPGCCRKTFENYFEVLDEVADGINGIGRRKLL